MDLKIQRVKKLAGSIEVPGDKSISHRALMLTALAIGSSEITGLSSGRDVLSTAECLKKMAVEIIHDRDKVIVRGKGLFSLQPPKQMLDAGNSGTTMRLLTGILAGQKFSSTITGDESLRNRPMNRIISPLRDMGADISGSENNFAPLEIVPGKLQPYTHSLQIASAQVKSCLMLAGLFADGKTTISEPSRSRDHTERMLAYLGGEVFVADRTVSVSGKPRLSAKNIKVPGDISSAAFFMLAASMIKNSELSIKNIGVNQSRTGIVDVLKMMGGVCQVRSLKIQNNEEIADIYIKSGSLSGVKIAGNLIPRIIDEIPILAVAATQANGETVISNARELRVKESDRIKTVIENLRKMKAEVEELPDGMIIKGNQKLQGAVVDSFGDHRIAMAFAVAGLVADGYTIIKNAGCTEISFPGFFDKLKMISHE